MHGETVKFNVNIFSNCILQEMTVQVLIYFNALKYGLHLNSKRWSFQGLRRLHYLNGELTERDKIHK